MAKLSGILPPADRHLVSQIATMALALRRVPHFKDIYDHIFYISKHTFTELVNKLKSGGEVSNEDVEQLLAPVPVDVHLDEKLLPFYICDAMEGLPATTYHGDIVEKLGAKATLERISKAREQWLKKKQGEVQGRGTADPHGLKRLLYGAC